MISRLAGLILPAALMTMVSVFPAAGQRTETAPSARPAANLLLIVADIQRHINDDVYKFAYPTDSTGQNLFRACLVRLVNYEEMHPGRMSDVVSLAKAQCFEKLRAFAEASANYLVARKSSDSTIKKAAEEGYARAGKFTLVAAQKLDLSTTRNYETDLQKRIRDFDGLATEFRGTPHAALALVEKERAQMQLAEFYIAMRFMQPYSVDDALLEIKRNIDRNNESKLLYAHHLMLADLYFDLAKEYSLKDDPEGVQFDRKRFEGFVNAARAEYHIVQQADGFAEKTEGRAKMSALEAFVERVAERAR